MNKKQNKFKETVGTVYLIIAFYIGIYYLAKWTFSGLFLLANWSIDKIRDHNKKKCVESENTPEDSSDASKEDFAKEIYNMMVEDE